MSKISEQIKELRDYGNNRRGEISELCLKAADTIEALSRSKKSDMWISVDERLPEICEKDVHGRMTFSRDVLTSQKYGNGFVYVGVDKYTTNKGGGWLSEVPFDDPRECCEVIAWMPLPERYKED